MSRYTKRMGNQSRYVRLPVLPSWEKLLSRLYVLPDTHADRKSVRLELLGILSNSNVTVRQLLSRLCVVLPKIGDCDAVIIVTKSAQGITEQASTMSRRKTDEILSIRALKRHLEPRSTAFNRRLGTHVQLGGSKKLDHYHFMFLGEWSGQELYLIASTTQGISGETARALEVIGQVVGLRLESVRLAAELASQRTKLSNLTQQLGEGMMVLDNNLNITLWNRSLQKLTGYKPNEVVGRNYQEAFRRLDKPDWLKEALEEKSGEKGPKHLTLDFEIATNQGSRWVSVVVSAFSNDESVLDQIVLIARDISHSKHLEQKKNEFISIATHELRTPLTAIKGYLSLLERDKEALSEKQINYIDQATKATHRLVRLAEDLLKVVQIEQGRLQVHPTAFQLFPLLKKIVRDFKPRAASKGLTLSLNKPSFSTPVLLDPERTEQIFANLIDNALKYTHQGSVKISMEIIDKGLQNRSSLATHIRDTGIGIGSKNIEEIFEKFHRVHRLEQSREQGAGLGLYIVRSFIEKQGGMISVKSREGKGTVFTVTVPLYNRHDAIRQFSDSNHNRLEEER